MDSVPAAAGAAAAATAPPPKLGCGARRWPRTPTSAADVRGAAVGAVRLLAVSHELLEVRLAGHAHVLVDRHRLVSLTARATIAAARYPLRNWSTMFDNVTVIGAGGRAGSAISARLRERGIELRERTPTSSFSASRTRRSRTWPRRSTLARGSRTSSGTTPLAALDPHERRFSVHPLQTLVKSRGPEQLDGAFAAVTGGDRRRARARDVARDDARPRAVPARRRRADALPRGRRHRIELPRHPLPSRGGALRGRRCAAGGARAAHAADDRERLRADRADRARRLGDGGGARRGTARAAPGARARLPRARGGDGDRESRADDRRGACVPRRDAGHARPRADDGRVSRRATRRSSPPPAPSATLSSSACS